MGRDAHGSGEAPHRPPQPLGPDEILRFLEATRRSRGLDFVERAVAALAAELEVDMVFVGLLAEDGRVRSVAGVDGGAPIEPFAYDLPGTPCEHVVGQETCVHPQGVADAFPEDAMLRDGGFEGYVGTPLFALDGQPIGIVVALHRTPLADPERIRAVFDLWSDRIGVELDRHVEHARRLEVEAKLARLARMDAADAVAAGVLHDLNNVLAAISVHAEMLAEDLPDGSAAHENVRAIADAARSGATLCERSRRNAATTAAEDASVDVVEIARTVCTLLEPRAPDGVILDFAPATNRAVVRAGRAHAERLLVNLVTNAIEAVEAREGAGRVTVAISLDGGAAPPAVRIRVEDDGCGMTPEVRARIFEPFYSTKGEGRGVGLASVAAVVDGLAGEIDVVSSPGHGTAVTVALPGAGDDGKEFGAPPEGGARSSRRRPTVTARGWRRRAGVRGPSS